MYRLHGDDAQECGSPREGGRAPRKSAVLFVFLFFIGTAGTATTLQAHDLRATYLIVSIAQSAC